MFVDNMYLACVITVVAEVLFFAVAGFWRKEYFLPLCAAANVATNLSLSLLIRLASYFVYWGSPLMTYAVIFMEVLIVLAEYGIYSAAEGKSRKLFILTIAANLVSILAGYGYWLLFY